MTIDTGQILDGKTLAIQIEEQLKQQIKSLGITPGLAVVLVGDHPASKVYIKRKRQACQRVGIFSDAYALPADVRQIDLLSLIDQLNQRKDIHGILIQLPLPSNMETNRILATIHPAKDVDGFHPLNMGGLFMGKPKLVPCTPLGIMQLLHHYGIPIAGKKAVVIGRSNIVGKPMAMLLLQHHATVTICHSQTADLIYHTRSAEILIVAAGQPQMITGEMVSEGATVIDVGIHKVNETLIGDIHFASVAPKAAHITPVPGGVGPMTVAMLLWNTVQAAQNQIG